MKKTNKILSLVMAMILMCLSVVWVYAEDITIHDEYMEFYEICDDVEHSNGDVELSPLTAEECSEVKHTKIFVIASQVKCTCEIGYFTTYDSACSCGGGCYKGERYVEMCPYCY